MDSRGERIAVFVFGVAFVSAILVLAVFFPDPTNFQYTVFRIVLALAAAGVAAFIPGFLHLQVNNWLRAGGAMAVFAIVFFFSPAQLMQGPKIPPKGKEVGFVTESIDASDYSIPSLVSETSGDGSRKPSRYNIKFTVWNNSPFEKVRISKIENVVIVENDTISFCCPETRSLFMLDIEISKAKRVANAWSTTVEIPPLSSHSFDAEIRVKPGDPDREPIVWIGLIATLSGPNSGLRQVRSDKVYLLNYPEKDMNGAYDIADLRKLEKKLDPMLVRMFELSKVVGWLAGGSPPERAKAV